MVVSFTLGLTFKILQRHVPEPTRIYEVATASLTEEHILQSSAEKSFDSPPATHTVRSGNAKSPTSGAGFTSEPTTEEAVVSEAAIHQRSSRPGRLSESPERSPSPSQSHGHGPNSHPSSSSQDEMLRERTENQSGWPPNKMLKTLHNTHVPITQVEADSGARKARVSVRARSDAPTVCCNYTDFSHQLIYQQVDGVGYWSY